MKIAKWIGVLAALLLVFWLGMRAQARLYEEQCMDLGGGKNHLDAGASFPICVLDVGTYRQRHAR